LSRKGQEPVLPAREVSVRKLEINQASESFLTLTLTVSKGYFVRSLARDICAALGVPGHLSELRRLQSGTFTLAEAVPWPATGAGLMSLSVAARRCLPAVELGAPSVLRARQGRELGPPDFSGVPPEDGPSAWFDPDGQLVAIGQATGSQVYRVIRGFVPVDA
jgi:tRNA pseudouridine55 synthase